MATVFEDVPSWPSAKTEAARDPRYDNQPPLEERVMLEFVEDLEREGVTARIQELSKAPAACRRSPTTRSRARSATSASWRATSRSASMTPARSTTARC
jgi:hypothetical protein